jgi:hypothetical protein|tara:strand:+ start:1900 stop:2445 length:546 start_codon:yes stop_codon:yes gene_type:complete
MNELKITNQLLKQMGDVKITSNVRELLIDEDGDTLIKVSDIKKLFVECGGSSFDHLLTYNNGNYGREGWETSYSPENFYFYYDDDESIKGLDKSELSEKLINDCLSMMYYSSIGNTIFERISDTNFRKDKLSETYIPFSLVLNLFSIETDGDYYIVGCKDDIDEIYNVELRGLDYFNGVDE